MKTKLKILKILTGGFVTLLFFTFLNCNDMECHDYPPGGELIYEFHEEDSLKIPYTGTDTLTFLRTKNGKKDTVVFIGKGKNYYTEWLRYENEESDCQYSVSARRYKIDYVAQNEADLKFEFVRVAGRGSADDVYIKIKDLEFFYSFWRWNWYDGYYEYITFNNKIYRKVQEAVKSFDSIINSAYYNFDYGIIRFELNYLNEIYQLID